METKNDLSNPRFQLALSYVNHSSKHIFLTGRAGTGKTTLLKHIVQNCSKNFVIVAPTGVAAINAGGVTAHSMFQLPMGVYIPGTLQGFSSANSQVSDRHSLFKNLKVNNDKRKIWQELDLLIIDEISMLRADMLDAIDHILRHFRKQPHKSFGGVQVLYIGDMFQLPPVVSGQDWELLGKHYNSPFFFDSLVAREDPPVIVELNKIYRQNEKSFIRILNNIRNNQADYDDLEALHERYLPDFQPDSEEGYILLTSHNAKADTVNQKRLGDLQTKPHYYEAIVTGDFNDKAYPADSILQLKVGAQIMFIKNDKGEARRYYNGKIGMIKRIDDKGIAVGFNDSVEEIILEREEWKNIRYKYNEKNASIDEEELGSFSQFPIRLAWAITIHKSQGLTFERAIVDAGGSFAPGQVYVALSRLTSLQGLVLHSRIEPRSISTDQRVVEYSEQEMSEMEMERVLEEEQERFLAEKLMQGFDFTKLKAAMLEHNEGYGTRQIADKQKAMEWGRGMQMKIDEMDMTGLKFRRQLHNLLPEAPQDHYQFLHVRVDAATKYFLKMLQEELFVSLKEHFNEFQAKAKTKKYMKELSLLDPLLRQKEHQLKQIVSVTKSLSEGHSMNGALSENIKRPPEPDPLVFQSASFAPVDSDTKQISYEMFTAGKTIHEIAAARGMVVSTIESHLLHFIKTGEMPIEQLVPEKKLKEIMAVMKEANSRETGLIKNMLGDQYSYNDIRAVQNYLLSKDGKGERSQFA